MKKIVTHINPDLDAMTSVWLIKRFWPGWQEAETEFVKGGSRYEGQGYQEYQGEKGRGENRDGLKKIVHVDVGLGKFDHHQSISRPPAAVLVWKETKKFLPKKKPNQIKALQRLVEVVRQVDIGDFINWVESPTDRYYFNLSAIIDGWKLAYRRKNKERLNWAMICLDGVYQGLLSKIEAEAELKKALEFETQWGKAVAVETKVDQVIEEGEFRGYSLVVRKDPKKGNVRIYGRNDRDVNLTAVWHKLQKADPKATWYLHQSKCMILNGSGVNPEMIPTTLSLEDVIVILRS